MGSDCGAFDLNMGSDCGAFYLNMGSDCGAFTFNFSHTGCRFILRRTGLLLVISLWRSYPVIQHCIR